MQVIKVDDSLAVLLPKMLIDELGIREGDDITVLSIAKDTVAVQKAATRAEFLKQIEQLRFPLPDGYAFDRDEANERR